MPAARPAAVAGYFYPARRAELDQTLESLLGEVQTAEPDLGPAKVLIAPHAGYRYSGAVAASGFDRFIPDGETIERIILLGPAHHQWVRGLALPDVQEFETPLGSVPVDQELVERISTLAQVSVSAAAHAPEHCLEVELPFLQSVLGEFTCLPLLVSRLAASDIAEVLERVWGGDETRIVVSSDLSHFLPYERARTVDELTAARILDLEPLNEDQACGACAINGILEVARRRGLVGRLLDLRNSGDASGDRQRVVGYGSFAFVEPS